MATSIFLMYHNLFFTSSHHMPYSHNPDASAAHFKEQSRNHGSVVCGTCAWLLSGVTLLHVTLSSPQTRQKKKKSLNTVELGPKEAVWIAIIKFSGEREPINIQVSPKHQIFFRSTNKYWEGWCSSGLRFLHV